MQSLLHATAAALPSMGAASASALQVTTILPVEQAVSMSPYVLLLLGPFPYSHQHCSCMWLVGTFGSAPVMSNRFSHVACTAGHNAGLCRAGRRRWHRVTGHIGAVPCFQLPCRSCFGARGSCRRSAAARAAAGATWVRQRSAAAGNGGGSGPGAPPRHRRSLLQVAQQSSSPRFTFVDGSNTDASRLVRAALEVCNISCIVESSIP